MQDQTRFVAPGIAASLSGATAGMPDTPIAEVSMSVFGDPDVVPLWFGESDLVTPDFVRDAAAKGLQAGETFYTWQRGIPELRAALAAYTERLYRIKCPADRITVTTGGMQAILLTCQLLLDPGDNIVIVSPIWPNITSATKLVGGEPKYVALDRTPTGGWTLDLQKVFDAVDARTRAIFVNSPGNPTGWTMTAEEQRTLLDFAKKRGLWIMADEVYARLIYSKRPDGRQVAPSFLEQAGPDDPLIVLNSFSKPWAMTGWRLGWLVGPPEIIRLATKQNGQSVSCAATFTMHACVAALTGPQDNIAMMRDAYQQRRDFMVAALNAIDGVECRSIEGAFYLFPRFPKSQKTSLELADHLLEKAQIAATPGIAFGQSGEGHLRFAISTAMSDLGRAAERLAKVAAFL